MKSQTNSAKPADWRKDFDEEVVREAHMLLDSGKLEEFAGGPTYCVAKFRYGKKKDALQSESGWLSENPKGEKIYEEQQPDQHSPGS